MTVLPRNYIIGIIMFTMVIVGVVALISMAQKDNPAMVDQQRLKDFNDTFNVMDDVNSTVGTFQDNIENAESDFGVLGVLNSLVSSAWQSLRLLFSSFSFMNAVFGGLYTVLGIPVWVGNMIVLCVTVLFAFAIFSVIFQRDI